MSSIQQQSFAVISWNVLHMIHEINYSYNASPVVNRYRIKENWMNEKLRLKDMINVLGDLLVKYSSTECFICLQEVPGDLIPMLDEMFAALVGTTLRNQPAVHVQVYPRQPRLRGPQTGVVYVDARESLVTIHYDPHGTPNDRIYWTPCSADPGKGAMTVKTTSGLSVVNTHVPYDGTAAKALLSDIWWPRDEGLFVLVGDINRNSNNFVQILRELHTDQRQSGRLLPVAADKPSRVGLSADGTLYKTSIDHYVISASLKDWTTSPVVVFDEIGDVSDHYPVALQFQSA